MKSLFLDANILLAFHFQDAEKRQQNAINFIFQEVERHSFDGKISIITFYQLLYFIDKSLNSREEAANRAYAYLEFIELTPFNPQFLNELNFKGWPDYEDGLQYTCAQSGSCDYIITTNGYDFYSSKILVIDPLNFVLHYLSK